MVVNIRIISKEELKIKLDKDEDFTLVDILEPSQYSKVHITKAINIPLQELGSRHKELDKKREVVTYCYGSECVASKRAARLLAEKGFKISAYEGGIQEWVLSEMPTEGKIRKEKLKALFT
jgi:rhodanese-related sulfurtransferase